MTDGHLPSESQSSAGILAEVRRLPGTQELSEESPNALLATARYVAFETGDKLLEVDAELTHVYILIRGRVHVTVYDPLGKKVLRQTPSRGDVVGLFAVILPAPSPLDAEAVEPTAALRLTLDQIMDLSARRRDFQFAILRLGAGIAKDSRGTDSGCGKLSTRTSPRRFCSIAFVLPSNHASLARLAASAGRCFRRGSRRAGRGADAVG